MISSVSDDPQPSNTSIRWLQGSGGVDAFLFSFSPNLVSHFLTPPTPPPVSSVVKLILAVEDHHHLPTISISTVTYYYPEQGYLANHLWGRLLVVSLHC